MNNFTIDTENILSVKSPNGKPTEKETEESTIDGAKWNRDSLSPATANTQEEITSATGTESTSGDTSISISALSAADDSIVAIYGGKDETFMEVSTLEPPEEPPLVSQNEDVKDTHVSAKESAQVLESIDPTETEDKSDIKEKVENLIPAEDSHSIENESAANVGEEAQISEENVSEAQIDEAESGVEAVKEDPLTAEDSVVTGGAKDETLMKESEDVNIKEDDVNQERGEKRPREK